jgi:hypothetical protein
MSGNQTLGIPNSQARIDEVRFALAQVLPNVTRMRKVGLISFGPGPWNYSWTGEQSILQAKCLAEQSGGLYITVDTEQDLVGALEKTLDCPMISQRQLRLAAANMDFCPLLRSDAGAVSPN